MPWASFSLPCLCTLKAQLWRIRANLVTTGSQCLKTLHPVPLPPVPAISHFSWTHKLWGWFPQHIYLIVPLTPPYPPSTQRFSVTAPFLKDERSLTYSLDILGLELEFFQVFLSRDLPSLTARLDGSTFPVTLGFLWSCSACSSCGKPALPFEFHSFTTCLATCWSKLNYLWTAWACS